MRHDAITSDIPYSDDEAAQACTGPLHPLALVGLKLFNQGEYFEAHEALEIAWREDLTPIRDVYRSILQVGVGYYHILRGNYTGALKMFQRCRYWLAPFPDHCRGINLARLRADYQEIEKYLLELGPDHIHDFDPHRLKPIEYSISKEK